ncbi:placenta-expressed transcript 1 protein [Pteronotus mesoamericanus]|uniref:placenta-expressed transcript 1 protein n=1 Tax=Pteronotus mesoamericanus TaxID=1884717 RepID=UPI0023ED6075|nr:placenta-expressed transcript 1 protein [Pteronotus parnellii mesoamericanus]
MAVRGSTLPSLGLFLCLGMLFISASAANDNDICMFFKAVTPTTGLKASADVYEDNKAYTIFVPVNYSTTYVVLRALDTNNNSIGLWHKADLACNSSVLYIMKVSREGLFEANWKSPPSTNTTTVEIQAFAVDADKVATLSYLKLKKHALTTPSYSMISTTRRTTTPILTTTRILYPASTPTTTKSLANRIFLSPITDAIQILLVFLTSKLLF